ncbi:hypothetical protein [Natrialbaceae archaeon AArc-T1-2]|uniref:hypothetical protein n=1 Tax=Natrialbaceae archaeon AArc-T1-2 TaxID=3053904 RepID=UPI00255AA553|nr:hypothetical protein [Natrialbaceae archaeon AArc-T1-2]WIV68055.1 hypothetical protein QQ977_04810 [Natrialbaceae archaeon AArc-T1-2]
MRLSIPGVPGVYYDTDARSTALTIALTAAGRRAPKPQGYAVQVVPYLWSFDVDLREVPNDHPFQYLHPEGARSIDQLTRDRLGTDVDPELDRLLRFAWAVNEETETAFETLLGRRETADGVVIEIDEGAVDDALEDGDVERTDLESAGGHETADESTVTEIDVTEAPTDDDPETPADGADGGGLDEDDGKNEDEDGPRGIR